MGRGHSLRIRLLLGALIGLSLLSAGRHAARAASQEDVKRIPDVIYGRKYGVALTMDVFQPAKPSGIGVLYMVSGGWFSSHDGINPGLLQPFLDHGQTVFAVVHGSQPKFTIPEILQDIQRATRFVRFHAREYGVDPDRLGISGGSAGGHLSLMEGVLGKDGDPNAKDPVDRMSSRVQAVACFFPPTDFLNYGKEGDNALTQDRFKPYVVAFGLKNNSPEEIRAVARADSPVYFVTKATPPTLIIHGNADPLVPIQQSQLFLAKLEEMGVPHRLVVREGKGHGWAHLEADCPILADWFDQYLKAR